MHKTTAVQIEEPFAAQSMAKSLSIMLFLDMKNTNTMNQRATFYTTKHCSYHAADIALFQSLYTGRSTFLVMDNLRLSFEQGAWTGCTLVAIRVI